MIKTFKIKTQGLPIYFSYDTEPNSEGKYNIGINSDKKESIKNAKPSSKTTRRT